MNIPRKQILGFGLVVMVLVLVLPTVDLPDAVSVSPNASVMAVKSFVRNGVTSGRITSLPQFFPLRFLAAEVTLVAETASYAYATLSLNRLCILRC